MRKSKVGVGVIGVGGISGYVHLPGLRLCPQAEIVALCDVNPELLRRRAEEYGVAHTFTEYNDLLQHPAVDAVVIATPTIQHAPIALAAIAAGKHVLVEKQLGMNYAETVQMYKAANRAGVRHMTAFTYRFVPAMRYLKHLVGQGTIGLPRHLRVARLQDFPETDLGWRQQQAFLVYPGSPRDPLAGDPTTTFRYDQDFAFIQAIVDGRDDIPTFYEGMRCPAVIDAVLQSARERRWVDVADVPPVMIPIAATAHVSTAPKKTT